MTGDNAFAELIHEYVGECLPLAEQAADGFLEVERRWNAGQQVDDLAPRLKGLVHTVKGNSAMMGQSAAAEVAHATEDLFAALLADASQREPAALDLLLDGANLLIELVRSAASGKSDTARVTAWVQGVRAQLAGQCAGGDGRARRIEPVECPEAAIDTVRVDFRRLDALQEIVGEAIIAQSRLRDIQRRMVAHLGFTEETAELDASINAVEKTTQKLEDAVMATRLVPLSSVFGRFARLVRDAAQSSGKQVRLETSGGDTRLDKAIVDRLGEPLVHLITNAVVHGVEREDVRLGRGKPAEAVIRLSAAPVSDGVILTVSDDGGGLDADRIAERARALGLEVNSTAADAIYPAHLRARAQHRRHGVLAGRPRCRPRRRGELAPCDGRVHHRGERARSRHPVHPARAGHPRRGPHAPLRGVRRALCHPARPRRRDGARGGR